MSPDELARLSDLVVASLKAQIRDLEQERDVMVEQIVQFIDDYRPRVAVRKITDYLESL